MVNNLASRVSHLFRVSILVHHFHSIFPIYFFENLDANRKIFRQTAEQLSRSLNSLLEVSVFIVNNFFTKFQQLVLELL